MLEGLFWGRISVCLAYRVKTFIALHYPTSEVLFVVKELRELEAFHEKEKIEMEENKRDSPQVGCCMIRVWSQGSSFSVHIFLSNFPFFSLL